MSVIDQVRAYLRQHETASFTELASNIPGFDDEEEPKKREEWLAVRKEEGLKIDPETAEVWWQHGYVVDPYGLYDDLSAEEKCIGRNYFARNRGSDIAVEFSDLPDATRAKLRDRIRAESRSKGYDVCDVLDRSMEDF